MEPTPVFNRLITSSFDSAASTTDCNMNRLQDPSLISRISHHFMGIQEIFNRTHSLWVVWGALIIALFASFSLGSNVKLPNVFRFQKGKPVISDPLFPTFFSDGDDDEESEEEDDSSSYASEEDEEEEEEEEENEDLLFENQRLGDEDFRVAGSGNYNEDEGQLRKRKLYKRRCSSKNRFSWSDLTNGRGVVKLWDELGLGLGFENSSESLISMWDSNKNQITSFFSGGNSLIPAVVPSMSPAVIMLAGLDKAALGVWDTRTGRRAPEVFAKGAHRRGNIVGIDSDGLGKVYVSDDVSSVLTVRDLRKVGSPLESWTEKTVWEW